MMRVMIVFSLVLVISAIPYVLCVLGATGARCPDISGCHNNTYVDTVLKTNEAGYDNGKSKKG
jgi:hypothetical protein